MPVLFRVSSDVRMSTMRSWSEASKCDQYSKSMIPPMLNKILQQRKSMNTPNEKSKCCGKPKVSNYTDEGTGCYLCQGCLGEFIPQDTSEKKCRGYEDIDGVCRDCGKSSLGHTSAPSHEIEWKKCCEDFFKLRGESAGELERKQIKFFHNIHASALAKGREMERYRVRNMIKSEHGDHCGDAGTVVDEILKSLLPLTPEDK